MSPPDSAGRRPSILLAPGEQMLWQGSGAGRPFTEWLSVLLSIGFAAGWLALAVLAYVHLDKPADFGRVIAAFCLVNVGIAAPSVVSKVMRLIRAAQHSLYAVTDRRAIVAYGWTLASVESYFPAAMQSIDTTIRGDGRFDIAFAEHKKRAGDSERPVRISFRGVSDADHAVTALRKLAAAAKDQS